MKSIGIISYPERFMSWNMFIEDWNAKPQNWDCRKFTSPIHEKKYYTFLFLFPTNVNFLHHVILPFKWARNTSQIYAGWIKKREGVIVCNQYTHFFCTGIAWDQMKCLCIYVFRCPRCLSISSDLCNLAFIFEIVWSGIVRY